MDLRIGITGTDDDVAELHSLYEAILEDGELRPARKSLEEGRPAPGEMGLDEIVRLALDADLITAVASCITAWLTAKRGRLHVVVQGPGGSARIDAEGTEAVTRESVSQALELATGRPNGEAARP